MALYGVDFYGASRYGPRIFLDFDANPMRAISRDYGKIDVSWASPGGNWSILRVVRNAFGTPVSQVDGQILVDANSGPAATGTVDPPVNSVRDVDLVGGRFYYYAVWLYVPSIDEWTRAAYTTGLAVQDYGYADRLWRLTPSVHRTTSGALLDQDNETLKSYLKIPSFQLDHIRAEYETLRHVNDPHRVSGGLLPVMAQQYGQFFEPELGMAQMRKLLASTVYLYRNKGTVPGIEGFVNAVSGFGAEVLPLKNLMLDYNDSSAEESVGGFFNEINSDITRYVADGVIGAAGEFYEGQRQVGLFKHRAYAAGMSRTRTPIGAYQPEGHLRSIPVTVGQQYTFSAYARAGQAGSFGALVVVFWQDKAGNVLSESAGTAVNPGTADWSSRPSVTGTAPSGAVYAAVGLVFTALAANDVMYWDALQFEPGATATDFTDARLIDIQVFAPRVNLFKNPAPTSTSYFNAQGGAASFTGGKYRLTSDGTGGVSADGISRIQLSDIPLEAGQTVTVSAYVTLSQARNVNLQEMWAYSTSPVVAVPANTRTRVSATFTPPAGTGTGISFQIQTFAAAAGETIDIDSVLIEAGGALFGYFDGTTYAFTGETMWEGTPNLSRSHYYPQRKTKNYRMNALLADYTPMGSSYRLRYALS